MITLQSIRVRNFRSIREATFKPLEEGITGIFGSNGAGKTTFLSATMWALFGVRPPEGSVASLRREAASTNDECSVSVLFSHMNQQVEVIRELKGKSNAAVVTIYVDGIKQTVASVTAGDAWVMSRLGLDATGFETAFVIKQKELDKLITARPMERKQIIERLAGVETINMALKAAREAENSSKKVLANFPGSEQAVDEAQTQVSFLTDKLDELSVDREGLQATQQRLVLRSREVQGVLDANREAEISLNRDEAQLNAHLTEVETLREREQSLAYLSELEEEGDNVEALRTQHQQITAQLNEQTAGINELGGKRQSLTSAIERFQKRQLDLAARLEQFSLTDASEDILAERITEGEREIVDLRGAVAVAQGHINDLHASITMLGHSDECPTCHTKLSDAHALVEQFQSTIVQRQLDIEQANERLSQAQGRVTDSKRDLEDLKRLQATQIELLEVTSEIEAANAELAELAPQWEGAQSRLNELQKQREHITELGLKARHVADDRLTFSRVQKRQAELENEMAILTKQVKAAKDSLQKANLQKLRTELAQLQRSIDENTPKLEQASGNRSQIEARLAVARNSLVNAADQWKRRQEMLRRQEERALVTAKLDKFRADTISSLAPELSEHASNLIGDMTNGEFTEVHIDDDFNPSVVTADGRERPVGWLSGGELSAVALSLRIAIGNLITGGDPKLLWLDEVLTAQDADRRTAMLNLIRSLPIDQIVMINHTSDAADIVDKTVTLKIDRQNGSYIADAE